MASSQVEIASSSAFGFVLRDRNQRDLCRDSNARAAFQKNIKELVRDHFSTCISSISDKNPPHQINDEESWVIRDDHGNDNTNGDESMGMTPRQSKILDRWAARQAREMVSTIERQTHEAEIQALLSKSQAVSTRATPFLQESSLAQSDTSVEIPNVGASSLVQMWEKRLNRSNSLNSNSVACSSSGTNSGMSYADNASSSSPVKEPSRNSEGGDDHADDERNESQAIIVDSFGDWELDRTQPSDPPSSLQEERDSDSGEREKVRVADIIKRLTSSGDDNGAADQRCPSSSSSSSSPRVLERCSALDQSEQGDFFRNRRLPRIRARSSTFDQDQAEQGNFKQLMRSSTIRGRQPFNDLIMQMERDRHRELANLVERRAVSRFQQRGRIQSMVRLRFLQHGLAMQEQCGSHLTTSNSNRPQGSSITRLRERFSSRVENVSGVTTRSDHEVETRTLRELGISLTSSQISEANHHDQEVSTNEQQQQQQQHAPSSARHLGAYAPREFHEVASQSSDVTCREARSFDATSSNLDTQETANYSWDENVTADDSGQNSYDWITDISRPRAHWEGRRQAWYQEMRDSNSGNQELRQLLERKRVSNFLASDFRPRMDQLMISHLNQQTQTHEEEEETDDEVGNEERMDQLMISHLNQQTQTHEEEEETDDEVGNEERMDQMMMSFLQRCTTHHLGSQEHDSEREEVEEEDEVDQDEEQVDDYFDQTPSLVQLPLPSSPFSSWSSSYRDHEVGNNDSSNQQSRSYYKESPLGSSSSTNRHSLEMELIYDLRGHMEQLHHEMYELRKSIKSCMDMQVNMQHSYRHDDHSVRAVGKKSLNGTPKKGCCCICYEMPVDSLLYRCGHMCTCLKCAQELQCSSGICPICRAPIVDVVRAFLNS